ncbi:hypothetical protein GTA62_15565 [Roseobacter sp. HKCCD9010]|nr:MULTISPECIES: glycosyltransferase family 4 protein [unclassified Roseobacter]MBF9050477.1 hypothetical protein [Rhodobacterales bacterium HKCCD4356]NNV12106.1 hypothetical protein [Roseobacter sp. HKCCD7357]NNV17120.1 hypothetical protein [Roseobacter sp. HKCCD8768]NNV26349.1 hypothetical protein [Roseobacter sp. HKCCD8192]NNV30844.1 hypothetical protein [Roseobacter sp. HKCCD9061]
MYPDDVVSARHLDGFAEDLAARGWDVEALPCNRGCRDERHTYGPSDVHNGVQYNRIWRPRFQQRSFSGRLLNSAWMIVAWSKLGLRRKSRRPDVIVIGTDPMFAVAAAVPLKFFSPRTPIVHWCFDLHPEAAVVSGMVLETSVATRIVKKIMLAGYKRCSMIADLGPCMRFLLRRYDHGAAETELIPWALVEPQKRVEPDLRTRQELFGNAALSVLYSGNFGEAHSYSEFLTLARSLRDVPEIHFCFAVRGNRVDELKAAVLEEDTNISFASFASIEELEKRLGAADIHLASLRDEWAGIAVPSKFFGSLAIGRPVLYSGPKNSAIGYWIERFNIGWVLNSGSSESIALELRRLSKEPSALIKLQEHSHAVYQKNFSRESVTDQWHDELSRLVTQ